MLALVLPVLSVLALSLGREVPLSTPVIEPAPFTRVEPEVASNGKDFLVVWTTSPYGGAVQGTRVNAEGEVLDAQPIFIGGATQHAVVASDGDDYAVAYVCETNVCVSHVDAETGVVTRAATLPNGYPASSPAIASNGSGYLVVTQLGHILGSSRLTGFPLHADATVAGDSFHIANSSYPAQVTSNGRDYLVVWSTYKFLEAVLVSDRAVIGETQRFTTFMPSLGPGPFGWSVASNGDDFLVAWQQNRRVQQGSYVTDLRVSRVSRDGKADELRRVLEELAWEPALTWTGSRYLLTYTRAGEIAGAPYLWGVEPADVHGMTVDAAGNASDEITFAARAGREAASASASNGATTLVVWQNHHRGDAAQIEGRIVETDRTFVVSLDLPWQESVAALRRGGNAVFAWSENAGEEQKRRVFVQRVDAASRTPRDGRGIAVGDSARHQQRPAMAGSLIAWIENDLVRKNDSVARVRARLLDATGAPIGGVMVVGDAAQTSTVAIAAAGSTHLIVWEAPGGHIAGAHVDPLMRPGETPQSFMISPGPLDNTPSVASDGKDFLVVWQRDRYDGISCVPGCTPPRSIHSATVTSWGVVGSAPVEVAERDNLVTPPLAVFNGNEYAIFWSVWYDAALRVQRVNRGGLPIGGQHRGAKGIAPLAVAWTGSEYLLATAVTSRMPLSVFRLDRELAVTQKLPIPSAVVESSGVAVMDGWVAYSAGRASRVAARPLADDLPASRRRSAR